MKKLIFLLIPFFLFANVAFYTTSGNPFVDVLEYQGSCSPGDRTCNNGDSAYCLCVKGKMYLVASHTDDNLSKNYNKDCLIRNSSVRATLKMSYDAESMMYHWSSSTSSIYWLDSPDGFCQNRPGYVYDKTLNAWINKNNTDDVICPGDKKYSSKLKKCMDLTDCPQGQTIYQGECIGVDDLLKKLLSPSDYDYYKNNCQLLADEINAGTYKICDNRIVCDGKTYKTIQVSCGSDKDTNIICNPDQNMVIKDNGDVFCEDSNNTIPHNSTGSADSNASNSSGSNGSADSNASNGSGSSGSADSNASNGSGSSGSDKDCCYLYSHPQVGDSWTQVSPGLWKQSNSPYCQVSIKDGKCSLYSSNSNELSSLSSKVSQVNSKLSDVNNNIKNMINLKPNQTPNGDLDSDTKTFLSGFSDTFSNIKSSVSSLKDSAGKIQALLENPSKVTLFSNSDIRSCPVIVDLYSTKQTFDICKMVSPYRPLVQLFFTLFFSISVLLYFFDVFIRSR